jgi:putative endonuclease
MATDPRPQVGRTGEQLAAEHLERLGYTILERNFRTRWGELDIVAFDPQAPALIFCEVKTRRARGRTVTPLESVHPRKRSQVRKMAGSWLAARRDRPHVRNLRFDAIGVTLDSAGRLVELVHLEGAF